MFTYSSRKGRTSPSSGEGVGVGFSIGVGILGTANTNSFIQQKIHRYATLIREGAFYLSLKSGRYLITQKTHWCRCKRERSQCKCGKSSQRVVKRNRISSEVYIPEISARDVQELLEVEENTGDGGQVRLYLKTEQEMDPIQLSEDRLLIEKESNASQDDFLILRLDRSKLPKSADASSTNVNHTLSTSPIHTETEIYPLEQLSTISDKSHIYREQLQETSHPMIHAQCNNHEVDDKTSGSNIDEGSTSRGIQDFETTDSQIPGALSNLYNNTNVDINFTRGELLYATEKEQNCRSSSDRSEGEMAPLMDDMVINGADMLVQSEENKCSAESPSQEGLNPFLCFSPLETVFEETLDDRVENNTTDSSFPLISGVKYSDRSDPAETALTDIEEKNTSDIYKNQALYEHYSVESLEDKLPSITEETKEDFINCNEDIRSTTPTRSSNSINTTGSLQSISQPTTPLPHRRNFSNNSQTSTKNSIISLTSDAEVRRGSHHKVSKSLDIQRAPISEPLSSEKKKKGLMSSLKRPVRNLTRSATGLFQNNSTSPKRRSGSNDYVANTTNASSDLFDQVSLSPTKEKKGILSSTKKFFRKRTISMNI